MPAVETLEKLARAPRSADGHQLFHDGEVSSASVRNLKLPKDSEEWGQQSVNWPITSPSYGSACLRKWSPHDQKLLFRHGPKSGRGM